MKAVKRWGKRIGLGVLALLAAAIMIGAGYEARMRRQAAVNHPAPGQLVDIGGRKIHLDCRGSGSHLRHCRQRRDLLLGRQPGRTAR